MKTKQGAVDVAPFSAIFFIVLRLLTRAISNLALQAIERSRMCRGILRDEGTNLVSISVSGQLRTYPSPNSIVTLTH